MNQVSIRQAAFADLETIVPLFDQYRQFQGQPSDLSVAHAFLRSRFDHGDSVVFLAWHGRDAVGFAHVYAIYSSITLKRAFILNDLFVLPAARRSGVAAALLAAVEEHAWKLDASRVTLTVARFNTDAQATYVAAHWQQDEQFYMYNRYRDAT